MKKSYGRANRFEWCKVFGIAVLIAFFCFRGYAADELLSAAYEGNTEEVKSLIAAGADVNAKTNKGYTPLQMAAYGGHVEVVKLLISAKADINAKDKGGWTPLMTAATQKHPEIVKILLDAGADINAKDDKGITPLKRAAHGGHVEVVKLLINAKADVNAIDKDGWTPLMSAATQKHPEIVKILLDAGADIGIKDKDGHPVLYYKMDDQSRALIKDRASEGDIWLAASEGKTDFVKKLIAKGADVNAKDDKGITPLERAVHGGHVEVVKLLINAKADVNAIDKDGWTPLMSAAWKNHPEIIKILLDAGADVNAKTNNGYTPLKIAAHGGHVEVVKLLINAKADVNAIDKDGWTPLMSAATQKHPEIVKILLDAGADIGIKNKDGHPVLYYKMDDQSRALISQKKPKRRNPAIKASHLINATMNRNANLVKSMIDDGADVNAIDERGETAFSWAILTTNLEIAKLLIDAGADVNKKYNGGRTALHTAANTKSGRTDFVKLLIDAKADVNAKDRENETALHIAASKGHTKVVKLLIDAGADVNAKAWRNETPLYKAAAKGHTEVAKLLIAAGAEVNDEIIKVAARGGLDMKLLNGRILSRGIPGDADGQMEYAVALMENHQTEKFEKFLEDDKCLLRNYEVLFIEAAKHGSVDIAKILWPLIDTALIADRGIGDFGEKKIRFTDIYFYVIRRGDKAFLDWLIEQKAPFDWEENGAEAVLVSATIGSIEMMDFLKRKRIPLDQATDTRRISMECNPFKESCSCYTALAIASYNGDLNLVKYLVESGANVNRVITGKFDPDTSSYTALLSAAKAGKTEVCLYLISKGANPNFVSGGEFNSVLVAKKFGFNDCAEALVKAGGVSSKLQLRKLALQQQKEKAAAEEEQKKKKAAAAAERRKKFLSSLKGVEKAAAEVIIRNLEKNKKIASQSLFGAFLSDVESEVVAITLTKEKTFGNVYVGYYTLRVTGGLTDISHSMTEAVAGKAAAEENKNQRVKIRVTYTGKKCLVDAYIVVDAEGNTTVAHWE